MAMGSAAVLDPEHVLKLADLEHAAHALVRAPQHKPAVVAGERHAGGSEGRQQTAPGIRRVRQVNQHVTRPGLQDQGVERPLEVADRGQVDRPAYGEPPVAVETLDDEARCPAGLQRANSAARAPSSRSGGSGRRSWHPYL
jgi:hypothetical protein